MLRPIGNIAKAIWDEASLRLRSIFGNCKTHIERAFKSHGGIVRLLFDVIVAVAITALVPILAVGIAAANFTDEIDGFGAVLSLLAAFAVLELIALVSLEIIAFFVAIQIARVTSRFLGNYKRRRDADLEKKERVCLQAA